MDLSCLWKNYWLEEGESHMWTSKKGRAISERPRRVGPLPLLEVKPIACLIPLGFISHICHVNRTGSPQKQGIKSRKPTILWQRTIVQRTDKNRRPRLALKLELWLFAFCPILYFCCVELGRRFQVCIASRRGRALQV